MTQLDFFVDFFRAGDRVKVLARLIEPANDCHPAGVLAGPGEEVVIRAVSSPEDQARYAYCREWPLSVSHDSIHDNSFRCGTHEVAPA